MSKLIEEVVDGRMLARAGEVHPVVNGGLLSAEGEKYATLRAMGYSPTGAIRAIGGTGLRHGKVDGKARAKAARFENDPLVKNRIDELVFNARAELERTATWTREKAVVALELLVRENVREVQRLSTAVSEEIDSLVDKLESEELSPAEERDVIEQLEKVKRRRVLSSITNQGITNGVAELNKMFGFSETTVKHDHQVSFIGEENLMDSEVVEVVECQEESSGNCQE